MRPMKRLIAAIGVAMIGAGVILEAQGIRLMSGASSDTATVNTNKSILTTEGKSAAATYEVHVSAIAVTASDGVINLESESGRGFRISQVCINPGQATAAAWVQWQLIRTTTASSGGTVISSESTTTHSITKMDPADATWSGLARFAATEGTSGAVLDAGTLFVNIAATPPSHPGHSFCREYGMNGGKLPTVGAGVANGVKLMFTGTAGGAGLSAMIRFIAE
jgi:hypothetical protein